MTEWGRPRDLCESWNLCYKGLMPARSDISTAKEEPVPEVRPGGPPESPRKFTLWQRFVIFLGTWVGYGLIALVGKSLRWKVVGWEHWEGVRERGDRIIYTHWHRCIFPGVWFWRKRGIVAMTSQNFDGEYTTRIIRLHGYGAARGSTSRGAIKVMMELIRHLRQGNDVDVTADGPRGPRFVAKPGPVLLAKKTGQPIVGFHLSPEKCYTFRKSWDQFQVPYPFSRIVVLLTPPIYVSAEADEAEMERKHQEMQRAMDQVRREGDSWWDKKR